MIYSLTLNHSSKKTRKLQMPLKSERKVNPKKEKEMIINKLHFQIPLIIKRWGRERERGIIGGKLESMSANICIRK